LAEGVLRAMSIGKAITASAVFLLAIGLVSGVGVIAGQTPQPESDGTVKANMQPIKSPPGAEKGSTTLPTAADRKRDREAVILGLEMTERQLTALMNQDRTSGFQSFAAGEIEDLQQALRKVRAA